MQAGCKLLDVRTKSRLSCMQAVSYQARCTPTRYTSTRCTPTRISPTRQQDTLQLDSKIHSNKIHSNKNQSNSTASLHSNSTARYTPTRQQDTLQHGPEGSSAAERTDDVNAKRISNNPSHKQEVSGAEPTQVAPRSAAATHHPRIKEEEDADECRPPPNHLPCSYMVGVCHFGRWLASRQVLPCLLPSG